MILKNIEVAYIPAHHAIYVIANDGESDKLVCMQQQTLGAVIDYVLHAQPLTGEAQLNHMGSDYIIKVTKCKRRNYAAVNA